MGEGIYRMVVEYGLAAVFGGAIVSMFVMVLRWVLKQQNKILDLSEKRDQSWQKVFTEMNGTLQKHMDAEYEFHESVSEAHKRLRSEHDNILEGLIEVNRNLKKLNGTK